jgi:hypothetical protein
VELLAVVEAEEQADALVHDAQARKEQAIRDALKSREEQLAKVKPPVLSEPKIKPVQSQASQIKERARKNKVKAIAKVLEEIYAS